MTSSDNNALNSMTAYQRWELASLDEKPSPASNIDIVKLAEEMISARAEAYDKGLESGRVDGFTEGFANGLAEGQAQALAEGREQMLAMGKELTLLIQKLEIDARQARENIADQLLILSLDIAQAILKTALSVQPELILPIIEQALHTLPCLQLPAVLVLHPDDVTLVNKAIGTQLMEDGWRIIMDSQLQRGECRIQTGTNEIDITLKSRWQRLQQELGVNTDWLKAPA